MLRSSTATTLPLFAALRGIHLFALGEPALTRGAQNMQSRRGRLS